MAVRRIIVGRKGREVSLSGLLLEIEQPANSITIDSLSPIPSVERTGPQPIRELEVGVLNQTKARLYVCGIP